MKSEKEQLVDKDQDLTNLQKIRNGCKEIVDNFKLLKTAPASLWVTFILKFFSSYAYFSFSLSLVLYLSEDFNMSDTKAGWYYGLFGILITIYGFAFGFAVDWIGVRWALLLGSIISLAAHLLLTFSKSQEFMYIGLFLLMPIGQSLGIPVMTIGIRRCTSENNRKQAYGLFYTFMNIAALLTGPITDFFRSVYKGDQNNPEVISSWSPSRLVFLTGGVSQFCMIIICIFFYKVEEITTVDIQKKALNEQENEQQIGCYNKIKFACKNVFTKKDFWRLVVCTGLLIFVKLIFRHMDATLPKYMIREIGEDAKFGTVYSINPFMIILLVPIISSYSVKINSFSMILYGSWIAAASPFVLVLGASYFTCVSFIIILSLGEAVYSPPTYQYSMDLAPEGQEGMYTTLANAPLFAAKLIAGGMSGYLLEHYCPETIPRNCNTMWLIIGITTISSPILLTVFRFFLDPNIFRKNKQKESQNKNEIELNNISIDSNLDNDENLERQLSQEKLNNLNNNNIEQKNQ